MKVYRELPLIDLRKLLKERHKLFIYGLKTGNPALYKKANEQIEMILRVIDEKMNVLTPE